MGILGIFGTLGTTEILIILFLVLMIFGAKRIPEIARGLGKGIREFKSATSEISRELTVEARPPRTYQPPAQQPIHTSPPASAPPAGAPTPPPASGEQPSQP